MFSVKVYRQKRNRCNVTSGDQSGCGRPAVRFHHQVSVCGPHGLQIPPLAGTVLSSCPVLHRFMTSVPNLTPSNTECICQRVAAVSSCSPPDSAPDGWTFKEHHPWVNSADEIKFVVWYSTLSHIWIASFLLDCLHLKHWDLSNNVAFCFFNGQ